MFKIKKTFLIATSLLLLPLGCQIENVGDNLGTITIILKNSNIVNTASKSYVRLSSLRCMLYRDSLLVKDQTFYENNGLIVVSMNKITSNTGYWVELHGFQNSNAVVGFGRSEPFTISAGKTTEVEVRLIYFKADLYSPTNRDSISQQPVNFRWEKVAYAQDYMLEYSTDNNFITDVQIVALLEDTTYTKTFSTTDKWYYWKVACRGSLAGYGSWSDTYQFYLK